jgi:acetyltransferase
LGLLKPFDVAVVSVLPCAVPARENPGAAYTVARDGGEEVEIGVARYCSDEQGLHCDCSVAIDPMWQKRGVGRALMLRLIEVARARGIRRMYAVGDSGQAGARSLAEWLGFHSRPDPEDPHVTAYELVINP